MKYLIFYCLLFFLCPLYAHDIKVQRTFASHEIENSEISILEDPSDTFNPTSWDELVKKSPLFKSYDKGIDVSRSAWWVRLSIQNETHDSLKLYLYTDLASLEYVKLYQLNFFQQLVIDSAGFKIPFNTRKIKSNAIVFEVNCKPGTNHLFLKVKSNFIKFPFSLVSRNELSIKERIQNMYFSWLVGILITIILFSLSTIVYFKNKALYIKYFLYLILLLLIIISYVGYGLQYFWPNAVEWNSKSYIFIAILMASAHVLFAIDLLKIKLYSVSIYRAATAFAILILVPAVLLYFSDTNTYVLAAMITLFTLIPITAWYSYYPLKYKSPLIRYYLLGYAMFLLPTGLTFIKYLSLMSFNHGINTYIFTGMVVEIIFFTIALGIRAREHLVNKHNGEEIKIAPQKEFVTLEQLTKKENEIFNYAGQLLSDLEIAEKLGATIHTVKFHLKNIYEKLEVKNRIMLIQKYQDCCDRYLNEVKN